MCVFSNRKEQKKKGKKNTHTHKHNTVKVKSLRTKSKINHISKRVKWVGGMSQWKNFPRKGSWSNYKAMRVKWFLMKEKLREMKKENLGKKERSDFSWFGGIFQAFSKCFYSIFKLFFLLILKLSWRGQFCCFSLYIYFFFVEVLESFLSLKHGTLRW